MNFFYIYRSSFFYCRLSYCRDSELILGVNILSLCRSIDRLDFGIDEIHIDLIRGLFTDCRRVFDRCVDRLIDKTLRPTRLISTFYKDFL